MSADLVYIDLTRTICTTATPSTIYPGHPPLSITPESTIQNDGWSVHRLSFGTHTATHIDAPCHFIEGGRSIDEIGIHELVGLKVLVVDLSLTGVKPRQKIEWEDLERGWAKTSSGLVSESESSDSFEVVTSTPASVTLGEKVDSGEYSTLLVHTGWVHPDSPSPAIVDAEGNPTVFFDHPYFAKSVAARLTSPNSTIRVFGSDTPNPDETPLNGVGGADGHIFHHIFLGADGIIAENLTNLDKLAQQQESGGWFATILPMKIKSVDGAPVRAFAYRQPGQAS